MKFKHAVSVAVIALCVSAASGAAEPTVKPGYQPFPPTYDYPKAWTTIQSWIDKKEWSRIRTHGWNLFIGASQWSTTPGLRIYETWYNTPETFKIPKSNTSGQLGADAAKTSVAAETITVTVDIRKATPHGKLKAAAKATPVVLSNIYPDNAVTNPYAIDQSACGFEGKRFLNNGDYMIADVYFSKEFYNHIRDNDYFDPAVMNRIWSGVSSGIKDFPNETFQTKPMYWAVPQSGYSALPVMPDYNPSPNPANPKAPIVPTNSKIYNGFETWKQAVAVTALLGTPKTQTVTMSYAGSGTQYPAWKRTFANAPVVNVNDFYHVQIDQAAYDKLDATDKCILNQSANGLYGRDFKPGDYLVTAAMHVMARENATGVKSGLLPDPQHPTRFQNTWSLQTFWYAGGPGVSNRYTTDMPTNIPSGPWKNYAMCQSYDATLPLEGDGTPHVCSNPYIELAFPEVDRSVSSCLTCHSAGAYPAQSLTDTRPGRGHYDSPNRGAVPLTYYRNMLYTDFSWALPLSVDSNINPN